MLSRWPLSVDEVLIVVVPCPVCVVCVLVRVLGQRLPPPASTSRVPRSWPRRTTRAGAGVRTGPFRLLT